MPPLSNLLNKSTKCLYDLIPSDTRVYQKKNVPSFTCRTAPKSNNACINETQGKSTVTKLGENLPEHFNTRKTESCKN